MSLLRRSKLLLLTSLGAAGVLQAQTAAGARDVELDHIIIAVPSLKAGIAKFADRTGVTAVFGGQHPGRGTENALISLGPGRYVELLAPTSAGAAADSAAAGQPDLRLGGWALHTRALPQVIDRLTAAGFKVSGPHPGSRRKPDGAMLTWRTAELESDGLPLAPFVIEWGDGVMHPSTTSPGGCRLTRMLLETTDSTRFRRFFDVIGHEVNIRSGSIDRMEAELTCPKGSVMVSSLGR
jgi:hypothetical protein